MAALEAAGDANAASRAPALIAVSVVFTTLAVVACGLRLFARHRSSLKLRWNDYSITSALMFGFVGAIFIILEGASVDNTHQATKFDVLAQPWLLMSSTLAKLSICLTFIKAIGRRLGFLAWILAILIGIMASVNLAFVGVYLLRCRPLESVWDSDIEGVCVEQAVEVIMGYASGSFEVLSFFVLATLPIVLVREMDNRSPRWPFFVLSVFSMVSGVLSIVKTYQMSMKVPPSALRSSSTTVTLLGVIVQTMAIITANILPMSQLLPNQAHLTLASSSDTELTDRASTDSSSILKIKRSVTLTAKRPAAAEVQRKPSNRLIRKISTREELRKPDDVTWATAGIIKTTTIQVVEVKEDSGEDAGKTPTRGHTKAKMSTSENWKDIFNSSGTG